MSGAGTVRALVINTTEFSFNPFGDESTVISEDGAILAQPQLVPANSANGKAGVFQTQPEPREAIRAISVYECPDPSKVLILLVVYSPDGTENLAKSGFYDKKNTNVNAQLLKHATGNKSVTATNRFDFIDEAQNARTLTVTGSIGTGLLAKASFKITIKTSA